MAEFKKLSEVERIETASGKATVLVEEGGEIKRVPKKEVGGAGGYIIKLANSYIDDNGAFCFDESYDKLYDVLVAGGSVWADYTNAPEASGGRSVLSASAPTNFGAMQALVPTWIITDVGLILRTSEGAEIYYPNGSHNLVPIVSEK